MYEVCRVYWGSHGCCLPRGHDGSEDNKGHNCRCCNCPDYVHTNKVIDDTVCVAAYPYYGPETTFYGEDVKNARLVGNSN